MKLFVASSAISINSTCVHYSYAEQFDRTEGLNKHTGEELHKLKA